MPDEWLISVDDHVLEPAHVWQDRVPQKYRDAAPRLVRDAEGEAWMYEGRRMVTPGLGAVAGKRREEFSFEPISYDEMRPGCYDSVARLEDMDRAGVLASLCFPSFPRFCGQVFLEADDKKVAHLCVQAYNDWMIEEWCGRAPGRYIPLTLIPLWDPLLAAAEVRRTAGKGSTAVAFSENPANHGLPTIHDRNGHWDPFVAACEETGTVICMHIGSSSKMPSTSPDAPPAVSSTLTHELAEGSLADWLFSGLLVRYPDVKITYSEGQIGWIPYILTRADRVWEHNRGWADVRSQVPEPPSTYYWGRVFGCFFDDAAGLASLDAIGADQ